jgi:tRNA threonylcarbamoyladenosine biosynthesis protein TsaB
MIVLGIDTSTPQASVALCRDASLLEEVNFRLEDHHSRQLLPIIDWMLTSTGLKIGEVDLFAVATGPGGFTGLRIGIATALGLAAGNRKPTVGVSTLEMIAYPFTQVRTPVAALMDAKRGQVYFQIFLADPTLELKPLIPATAAFPNQLVDFINEKTYLVGGGAEAHRSALAEALGENALFTPPGLCYHRAQITAAMAYRKHLSGAAEESIAPNYVRPWEPESTKTKRRSMESTNDQR